MLSDQEIHQRLVNNQSLEDVCRRLIHDANARGGFDNVTVVLMRAHADVEADETSLDEETLPMTIPVEEATGRPTHRNHQAFLGIRFRIDIRFGLVPSAQDCVS